MNFLWVSVGGALGASARYAIYKTFLRILTQAEKEKTLSIDFSSLIFKDNPKASQFLKECCLGAKSIFFSNQFFINLGRHLGLPFIATLSANLIGAFLAGLIYWRLPHGTLRLFLLTGFMGGLTTMSSFNVEFIDLALKSDWQKSFFYLSSTVLGCLAMTLLGFFLAHFFFQNLK